MTVRVSKLEATRRQLRVAIQMMFDGGDPIAVHTLIGTASVLAADLARRHHPDGQWEKWAQDATGLSVKQYNDVARATQNFLKHADRDVDQFHEFDPSDTDALAFGVTRNLANFGKLGFEESAFELWYIACYDPSRIGYDDELFAQAAHFFGDLRTSERPARLAKGQAVLASLRASEAL